MFRSLFKLRSYLQYKPEKDTFFKNFVYPYGFISHTYYNNRFIDYQRDVRKI